MSQTNSNMASDTRSEPLISDYEKQYYWNGISTDPPHLLYRSDLDSNPFPHPSPGDRSPYIPVKSVRGVFNTPLNPVWDVVAPLIIQNLRNSNMALCPYHRSLHDRTGEWG
ncbi:hypothetical protein BJ165DRAFT_1497065 [Panaeolus papilionaceus]|nr:hypothetical protein BJ165DRAFT_1497065 [Panaeolus papilionaceus]